MKKQLLYILTLILAFASCDTGIYKPEDSTKITILLDISGTNKPLNNIHVYGFETNSNKLVIANYFSDISSLNLDVLSNIKGEYVFVAVLNVGEKFTPIGNRNNESTSKVLDITLTNFLNALKEAEPQYPDMVTGMTKKTIIENEENVISITIKDGAIDIESPILRLDMSLPDGDLPNFVSRIDNSNVDDYNVRVVIEVYKKGTDNLVLNYSDILKKNTLDINLEAGEYDILLWADYTPIETKLDYYYNTSSLKKVRFNAGQEYTASTDSRDAFSLQFEATVEDDSDVTDKSITLERPFAKYQISATDTEKYQTYIELNGYPELEDLAATISYEGYLPNSFNVKTGKPNDSAVGIEFTTQMNNTTDNSIILGSDYIFVNGSESFVTTTITLTDSDNNVITKITGVKIEYRRGYLTTITGNFLTAGIMEGGIDIDTNWEGQYDIEF